MIDPILSLAHSIQCNKGVFALLIGSGLSRSAGIPTGWEVTLELVRRLAVMEGEDPTTDPAVWYAKRYGKPAAYSDVLDVLAKTPSERRAILHSFFEPTEDEREQGFKLPTRAHRAIADVVTKGYIKVIVTTNFDRLMETALQDAGVTPVVISTTDAIKGAVPLIHQRCIVVKVHGDYLDERIKNTQAELSDYDSALNGYLDRIFDEFGLIVCGWSGEWDPALRSAIERCTSRRYTTFWATRNLPESHAAKLIGARNAEVIDITGADDFFEKLADKINSLEEIQSPSPLSKAAAVASVKRYVAEPRYKIRLNDLIANEVDRIRKKFSIDMPVDSPSVDQDAIRRRFYNYDALTEVLRNMLFHTARWAEPHHFHSIQRTLSLITSPSTRSGTVIWLNMRLYPASVAFYAACAGAYAAQNYRLLDIIFRSEFIYKDNERNTVPELCSSFIIEKDIAQCLHDQSRHTPMSDHLSTVIAPLFTDIEANPDDAFDRLEVMMALAHLDHQADPTIGWLLPGRFAWRHTYNAVFEEVERVGGDWAPLRAGMFEGKIARFNAVKEVLMAKLRETRGRYW